jgi:hypothetical protein
MDSTLASGDEIIFDWAPTPITNMDEFTYTSIEQGGFLYCGGQKRPAQYRGRIHKIARLGSPSDCFRLVVLTCNTTNVHIRTPSGKGIRKVISGSGTRYAEPKLESPRLWKFKVSSVPTTWYTRPQAPGDDMPGRTSVTQCVCTATECACRTASLSTEAPTTVSGAGHQAGMKPETQSKALTQTRLTSRRKKELFLCLGEDISFNHSEGTKQIDVNWDIELPRVVDCGSQALACPSDNLHFQGPITSVLLDVCRDGKACKNYTADAPCTDVTHITNMVTIHDVQRGITVLHSRMGRGIVKHVAGRVNQPAVEIPCPGIGWKFNDADAPTDLTVKEGKDIPPPVSTADASEVLLGLHSTAESAHTFNLLQRGRERASGLHSEGERYTEARTWPVQSLQSAKKIMGIQRFALSQDLFDSLSAESVVFSESLQSGNPRGEGEFISFNKSGWDRGWPKKINSCKPSNTLQRERWSRCSPASI